MGNPEAKEEAQDAKTDEKKKDGDSPSSSSDSTTDEDDTLSKEDVEKIKKLFNEQEAEIKSLEKQIEDMKAEEAKKEIDLRLVRVEYTKQVKENEATVKRYRKMIEDEK